MRIKEVDMNDSDNRNMNRDQAMQDIQTIKSFLEQGQRKLEDSGFHFMFWGLLIPAGFLAYSFIGSQVGHDSLFGRLFWPVLCGAGAIVSLIAGVRSSRSSGASRYVDRISSALWVGNLIAIAVLFAVLFFSQTGVSVFFMAMIAVILGPAYWVYGTVISLQWFSLVALFWWAAALIVARIPVQNAGAVLAAATFICSFIPGCILFVRKRKGGR